MTLASEFEQVKEFHETFSPANNKTPTAFTVEEALHRAAGAKVTKNPSANTSHPPLMPAQKC